MPEYVDKINNLIEDGSDTPISRNPSYKIKQELSVLLKPVNLLKNASKQLISKNSKLSCLYGLPKIHKETDRQHHVCHF